MATKVVIKGGVVHGVYDDRLRSIYDALGVMVAKRASDVEFDEETGDWVARLVDGLEKGKEIARGRNRGDVIAAEVRYLEERL